MSEFRDNSEPLIELLHHSFDPMEIPIADEIMWPTDEIEGCDLSDAADFQRRFGGRHWLEVGEELNGAHQDVIVLLSNVGLSYFLGAFMYASLLVRNNGFGFQSSTINVLSRIGMYRDSEQLRKAFDDRVPFLLRHKAAIIAYLEYFQDVFTGSDEEATLALDSYWSQHR